MPVPARTSAVTASRTRTWSRCPSLPSRVTTTSGRVTLEGGRGRLPRRPRRRVRRRGSPGPAAPVRPESAKPQQLDLGDAEGGGCRPQLPLAELADATGRHRDVRLDLARLAAGRADDDRCGRRAPPRASAASRSRTSRRRGGRRPRAGWMGSLDHRPHPAASLGQRPTPQVPGSESGEGMRSRRSGRWSRVAATSAGTSVPSAVGRRARRLGRQRPARDPGGGVPGGCSRLMVRPAQARPPTLEVG